jgi:hypothetical protein
LNGGDGQNTITGSANDDIIDGGVDADILSGGAGDDTFIYDATLDIVAGEQINGGANIDTIEVGTANALDFSLAAINADVEIFDLSTAGVDADVTLTGAQLNNFSILDVDAADSLTIDTINGLTMNATDGIDTFVFASTDTGVSITGFASNTDKADVSDFETAGALVDGTTLGGDLTDGTVYYLEGQAAGSADSTANALAAIYAGDSTVPTDGGGGTAWVMIADDNSSAIYEWTPDGNGDGATGDAITLIGTFDSVLVNGDLVI